MSRIKREASVILFDIGRSSVDQLYANGESYFDNARTCLSMILQRKLFTNKNDVVGLFLLGTEETENSLRYANMSLKFPLDPVTWDVLEFVEKGMKPTNHTADWLAAIVLGMQYIKDETEDQPMISGKKLILFSSFATAVKDDHVNVIVNGLKLLQIELIIIGPKLLKTELGEPTTERYSGEKLISEIVERAGGVITSFDEALGQLQFIEAKKVNPAPWNVAMDIGPDIKIKVTGYKKVAPVTLPSWKVTSNRDGNAVIATDRKYVKQDADQTPVEKDDVIPAYNFGSTVVPFSDTDDSVLKYQSGDKCLSILGFTDASRIAKNILVGDGTYYFMPQPNDPHAAAALSAFIGALQEKKMVAVARRVYRASCAPVVGVLIPKIRKDYECLVFIELPYAEDIRTFVFPSLSKTGKPSEQQLECVDALIDGMDLMTAAIDDQGNAAEAFHPNLTVEPYHQHFYAALCHRGLNPDEPLPPVKQSTLDLLKRPFEEQPAYVDALGKIKDSFPLVHIAPKEPRRAAKDIFKQDDAEPVPVANPAPAQAPVRNGTTLAALAAAPVVQIGTIDPVKDFVAIAAGSLPFEQVAVQMGDVVLSLVLGSFGSDDFDKASAAMKALRESCIARDTPALFNQWLPTFKERLLARGKEPFWEIVAKDQLGMISKTESSSSSVDEDEAARFLEILEEQAANQEPEQDMDIEDLLC